MGISPPLICSIFFLSISTQITLFPVSAKQVPVTRPTYPVPTTAMFMMIKNLKNGLMSFLPETDSDEDDFKNNPTPYRYTLMRIV